MSSETDLRKFAGFGEIGGRTLRTGYLLIRSNIWIQGKDTLHIDLKQRKIYPIVTITFIQSVYDLQRWPNFLHFVSII